MKKGQAAMEFLMTYGWAILVVLAAIGALAYFGVLSPDRFMPSKCMVTGGFSCTQYKIASNNTVYMEVQNNLGVDATNIVINLSITSPSACQTLYNLTSLGNGVSTGLISYPCGATSGKAKGEITITYTKSGETVMHTTTGSISGNVE